MFKVENADFIADKFAAELLPLQEFREVLKNAEEAIHRRMAQDSRGTGRIEFDVDWYLHERSGHWYVSCADDGDGMSRRELERYTTTLAVEGANQNQSIRGNQGMGLKISGPTRHREGILIRSMKDGERTAVQVGWNGHEYGLVPLGPEGELSVPVGEEAFPGFIRSRASGTVVTFLGNHEGDNTFKPADQPRGWLFRYLHRRFFELSADGIEVLVRVPTGDTEGWPHSREEADARGSARSFNLSRVRGTGAVWSAASEQLGEDYHGTVELPGEPESGIPQAKVHWWVLPPSGQGSDVSSRTHSGGSLAVLFQNELHDWRVGSQANAHFARLGVIYGKNRIGFVIEPLGDGIASDFARKAVLVDGTPALEHEAWMVWTDQFRERRPEAIDKTMADEQARLQEEDPERARRIRNRLKDVMRMLRPRKFRPDPAGSEAASGSVTGPGNDTARGQTRSASGRGQRKGTGRRGIGSVLSAIDTDGESANEIFSILEIEPRWVTEGEAASMAIVGGGDQALQDRAAALAGEDAATAGVLLFNREFRGYQALLTTLNEWANPEGDDDKATRIESAVQEWVEQKVIEAVHGLRQLENGRTWLTTHFDEALSPASLTAAFMADRYHTLNAVKRTVSALRT